METPQTVDAKVTKYIGGLPLDFEDLARNSDSKIARFSITGKSGGVYTVSLIDKTASSLHRYHKISIESEDHKYQFEATWNEKKDPYKNCMSFTIETADKGTMNSVTREYPTDMYAGRLVDASMQFMGSRHPIDCIAFDWRSEGFGEPASDNYIQYTKARDSIAATYMSNGMSRDEAEWRAKKEAASQTWTGKRVSGKHGFTVVKDVYEQHEAGTTVVTGVFIKP